MTLETFKQMGIKEDDMTKKSTVLVSFNEETKRMIREISLLKICIRCELSTKVSCY